MGPVTEQFEEVFIRHIGVKHAYAVPSETAAPHFAHRALGISAGGQVTIPFTRSARSSTYHIFPILLSDQVDWGDFISQMQARGGQTCIHHLYVHLVTYNQNRSGRIENLLPMTKDARSHEVTLPPYTQMTSKEVATVVVSTGEDAVDAVTDRREK
jgi:dTDP-4-amino-4,6-dideoxygalactose transaminase